MNLSERFVIRYKSEDELVIYYPFIISKVLICDVPRAYKDKQGRNWRLFGGNLITTELADRRKKSGVWNRRACQAGYVATYRLAGSIEILALGDI